MTWVRNDWKPQRRAIKSRTSSNSGYICLLREIHILGRWKNVVDMRESSFLDRIFVKLQVTRTSINTQTSSTSLQIGIFA